MTTAASLKERAALLGGHALPPKQSNGKTSLAFAFQSRPAAESLIQTAAAIGVAAALKSTYHAWLVTAVV